jgi:chemotaxis protein methyltransferase CheR
MMTPESAAPPRLGRSHFERFTRMVRDKIGVKLPIGKRLMIESRLRRRMTALEKPDLDAYLEYIFDNGALVEELDHVVDALTTNKTDFYRERDHFNLLRDVCIPGFHRSGRRMFKLWSAASSNGAEAWTSAIELAEAAELRRFEWMVLGTDINTEVLRAATMAVYQTEFLEPVPALLKAKYFMQGKGERKDQWRVSPNLRRRVRFVRMNLMSDTYPVDDDVDAIFLRNVLIYFEPDDQAAVIDRLASHLVPGGHLFVGHSESMVVRNKSLRQLAPAAFQKV